MYFIEPMLPEDIFSLDITNLDKMSENFSFDYYLGYLINHSYDFLTLRSISNLKESDLMDTQYILGYIFGKLEIKSEKLCLHLSAISISPQLRSMNFGSYLLKLFENNGNCYQAWLCDLYVRTTNKIALNFYNKNGYSVYRKIFGYYGLPGEDAYDMRKSLEIDKNKECMERAKDIGSHELLN